MELKDYLNVIFNRKWIIIGVAGLVVLGALILSLLQDPVYKSSALILVDTNQAGETASDSVLSYMYNDSKTFISTQAKIIATRTMAQAVRDRLEYDYEEAAYKLEDGEDVFIPAAIPSVGELQNSVTVERAESTNVFGISVTNGDKQLARDIAQTYADEYILDRQLSSIKQISDARKEVWNQITELETRIADIADEVKQYAKDNIPSELEAEAAQAVSLWGTLYEKYMSLRIAEALEQRGLEVIEVAEVGVKVSPRPVRNVILALFTGLLLGLGLAFLVDYLDSTLKTRDEMARAYDTTVIGEIARATSVGEEERGIFYFDQPDSAAAEGFRNLRTNLQFLNLEGDTKVLMVTSASPGEGKTSVAVNLAAALSEMNKRVLVVEADLRKPVLSRFLAKKPDKGITDVLMGSVAPEDAVTPAGNENLAVLTAGVIPPNPAEIVSSHAMQELLARLSRDYDFVLVDAPPVLAASDAVAMASMMDGVILVASHGKANRDEARHTVELLSKVETRVLGVVINNVEPGKRYGYRYAYSYDYGS